MQCRGSKIATDGRESAWQAAGDAWRGRQKTWKATGLDWPDCAATEAGQARASKLSRARAWRAPRAPNSFTSDLTGCLSPLPSGPLPNHLRCLLGIICNVPSYPLLSILHNLLLFLWPFRPSWYFIDLFWHFPILYLSVSKSSESFPLMHMRRTKKGGAELNPAISGTFLLLCPRLVKTPTPPHSFLVCHMPDRRAARAWLKRAYGSRWPKMD